MSVGIPVIASKVPSYAGSPAILCENQTDWYNSLNMLLEDKERRESRGKEGILYCKENFSQSVITTHYTSLFNTLLESK
jgi:hypothetical protein